MPFQFSILFILFLFLASYNFSLCLLIRYFLYNSLYAKSKIEKLQIQIKYLILRKWNKCNYVFWSKNNTKQERVNAFIRRFVSKECFYLFIYCKTINCCIEKNIYNINHRCFVCSFSFNVNCNGESSFPCIIKSFVFPPLWLLIKYFYVFPKRK